jgi:hypothetical protein
VVLDLASWKEVGRLLLDKTPRALDVMERSAMWSLLATH